MITKLPILEPYGEVSVQVDKAENAKAILILAHGAGAGMEHDFMKKLAEALVQVGITTVRFNFPYIEQGKKLPSSQKQALITIERITSFVAGNYNLPLFYSGKSYGGRMGSIFAAENDTPYQGLVYFGFPLHAPGKDSTERANHLSGIELPQLFLQGSKDKLANISLIKDVVSGLPKATLIALEHGDHSFKVPKASGKTHEEMIKALARHTSEWISNVLE